MPEKKEHLDMDAMPPSAADIRNEVIERAKEEDQKQAKAKAIQEQKAAAALKISSRTMSAKQTSGGSPACGERYPGGSIRGYGL